MLAGENVLGGVSGGRGRTRSSGASSVKKLISFKFKGCMLIMVVTSVISGTDTTVF